MFGPFLKDGTLIGDLLPLPKLPSTNNPTYGYFGCSRNGKGCLYTNYQEHSYVGKEKNHHGIDIFAPIGTNIHSIKTGIIVDTTSNFLKKKDTGMNYDVNNILSDKIVYLDTPPTSLTGWVRRIIQDTITTSEGNRYKVIEYRGKNGCHYHSSQFGNKIIMHVTNDSIQDINGNWVSDYYILYAHLNEVNVKIGDYVSVGEIIGTSGCSGNAARIPSNIYHVHIEANTTNNFTPGVIRLIDPRVLIKTKIPNP